MQRPDRWAVGPILLLHAWLVACSSPPTATVVAPSSAEILNERLAEVAGSQPSGGDGYHVGPGDALQIDVFQAPELARKVRVRPDGSASFPLIGRVELAGRTTAEVETLLADRWGGKYLRDPQVSVFVEEYRAHPVSVLGAVNQPGVYYLRESRTFVEILSAAGGLSDDAGSAIQLRRRVRDPESGVDRDLRLSIDIEALLTEERDLGDPHVRAGDTLFVPRAGVVYVEGAVKKAGAYSLHGAGSVLKAVTLAGGLELEASKSVQVIRSQGGPREVLTIDFDEARKDPAADIAIQDGDVVVVPTNAFKLTLVGLWRGVAGLVNVTKGF